MNINDKNYQDLPSELFQSFEKDIKKCLKLLMERTKYEICITADKKSDISKSNFQEVSLKRKNEYDAEECESKQRKVFDDFNLESKQSTSGYPPLTREEINYCNCNKKLFIIPNAIEEKHTTPWILDQISTFVHLIGCEDFDKKKYMKSLIIKSNVLLDHTWDRLNTGK